MKKEKQQQDSILHYIIMALLIVTIIVGITIIACTNTYAEEVQPTEDPAPQWYDKVADWCLSNADTIIYAIFTAVATTTVGVIANVFKKVRRSNALTIESISGYDDTIASICTAMNQSADELADLLKKNESIEELFAPLFEKMAGQEQRLADVYKTIRAIMDTLGVMVDKSTLPTATKERIEEIRAEAVRVEKAVINIEPTD